MNVRVIPGAYLLRLYVCDKEMSWPYYIGETHQPDWVVYFRDSEKFRLTNVLVDARANMNGRAIPGAYLFRLYVCDKEMSWPHHIGETHQADWVVYVRDSEKFRLTKIFFAVFRTRLTNMDSANECFSGCAR